MLSSPPCTRPPVRTAPGADIQAALNHGDAVLLQSAGLHLINETLRFTKAGQSLRTDGAGGIGTCATLRAAPGAPATLLDSGGRAGIDFENVILDHKMACRVTRPTIPHRSCSTRNTSLAAGSSR